MTTRDEAGEHYVLKHFREVTDAVSQLFHRDARPFIVFFMEARVKPVLWRLVKEAEENRPVID